MIPFSLLVVVAGAPLAQTPVDVKQEYSIFTNGDRKGVSAFSLGAGGSLNMSGDNGAGTSWSGTVEFENDHVKSALFEVRGSKPVTLRYTVNGETVTRTGPDGETRQRIETGALLYYPLAPVLLQTVMRRYKVTEHGFIDVQSLDMLTGKPRLVSIELNHVETRMVGGKERHVRVWRVRSAPSPEAVVYTDEANLPLYWASPAVQYEMVLSGFDELQPSYAFRSSLSPPQYTVQVDRDVAMTMRDGARLMADVYRPSAAGKYPVLFQRTCYDRSEFGNGDGEFYARRGYVYVTQHVRGRGNSQGEFTPFIHEAADGFDSIGWCASQPWSNGKVGMLGASYNAYCEWMAAKLQPPALKTMISTVAMPGPPDGAPWNAGITYVSGVLSWYGLLRDKAKTAPFTQDMTAAINKLPIEQADTALFGSPLDAYRYWVDADRYNDAVKAGAYRDKIGNVRIPVLHVSGWLDSVGVGTRLNYTEMTAAGVNNQKLIIGPWSHFTNRESSVGYWDFGPQSYTDLKTVYLRWFDRWLKDAHNGIDTEPPVSTYLLNDRKWVQSDAWPPKEMTAERWYLRSEDGSKPTHSLTRSNTGKGGQTPDSYTYDPASYAYSPANQFSFFFGWLSGADLTNLCGSELKDRLVYISAPLTAPMRLCGPVTARLTAATSSKDTDWVAALVDAAPDGTKLGLACGIVRARFRRSLANPSLLTPNEAVPYDVDMWETGVTIPAGHSLQIVVLSTLFPDTDRNLNTGGSLANDASIEIARQTIYHEAGKESYVTLPVVRGS